MRRRRPRRPGLRAAGAVAVAGVVAYDLVQRRHAILRNFPIVGHFRYLLEAIGPELRQYIVTGNDEERPFSATSAAGSTRRPSRRTTTSASAPTTTSSTPPGLPDRQARRVPRIARARGSRPTATAARAPRCSAPPRPPARVPARVGRQHLGHELRLAQRRRRRGDQPRRARSPAACRTPARAASPRHHRHGGDLVWQIGTGYFGCRDDDGRFDLRARSSTLVAAAPGAGHRDQAEPGREARARRRAARRQDHAARSRASAASPVGRDCISPPRHCRVLRRRRACSTSSSGSPTRPGCRSASSRRSASSASGTTGAARWQHDAAGPDFVTIDGGEGGTGAAPLVFTDHVALPFKLGFAGSTAPSPSAACTTRSCSSARASSASPRRRCSPSRSAATWSTSRARRCWRSAASRRSAATPATARPAWHDARRWLLRGLDPELTRRAARQLRRRRCGTSCSRLARACGATHPALVEPDQLELLDGERAVTAAERFGYGRVGRLPTDERRAALVGLMEELAARGREGETREVPTRRGQPPRVP